MNCAVLIERLRPQPPSNQGQVLLTPAQTVLGPIQVAVPVSQPISMVTAHPATQIVTPLQPYSILHPVVGTPILQTSTQVGAATPYISVVPTICSPRSSASWVPHPHPHPTMSPSVFWSPTVLSDVRSLPTVFLDTNGATRLTGGWPLPGTMPATWTFGAWPPVALSPASRSDCRADALISAQVFRATPASAARGLGRD